MIQLATQVHHHKICLIEFNHALLLWNYIINLFYCIYCVKRANTTFIDFAQDTSLFFFTNKCQKQVREVQLALDVWLLQPAIFITTNCYSVFPPKMCHSAEPSPPPGQWSPLQFLKLLAPNLIWKLFLWLKTKPGPACGFEGRGKRPANLPVTKTYRWNSIWVWFSTNFLWLFSIFMLHMVENQTVMLS